MTTTLSFTTHVCALHEQLPLTAKLPASYTERVHQRTETNFLAPIPVGTRLNCEEQNASFLVTTNLFLPYPLHALECPLLKAETEIKQTHTSSYRLSKTGVSVAWITLSDKGAQGVREDTSGPAIEDCLKEVLPISYSQGFLLPDSAKLLKSRLLQLALHDQYDIICTTGGTGLSKRDITPQTTKQILDFELPGFAQAMMAKSLSLTPHALLSRSCCGVIGTTLVLNLPGSLKAVRENLSAILPALKHTLAKLHNDPSDCGG
ncbi:MAG: MogA/MoaB family molybdenum cofactor biosynthesis protein [Desulfovibrio sp.]|nr:MogA/MoaB family molybdenum cofactor biosynthesis protein [Desulfovibrio sp.]